MGPYQHLKNNKLGQNRIDQSTYQKIKGISYYELQFIRKGKMLV